MSKALKKNIQEIISTDSLDKELAQVKPENLDNFFSEYRESLMEDERPFSSYMRNTIRAKGITQQEVFIRADISEKYGYKLIGEEKHPRHRDTILRLCFGAGFTLKETQRALKCSGFRELYGRIPRDAVLIVALNRGIWDIYDVSGLLAAHGEEKLRPCGEEL